MTQRGKISAASQMVALPVGVVPRLDPGEKLDKESQELWDTMIDSQANGWFTEEHRQILLALVHHTVTFKRLRRKIQKMPDSLLDTDSGLTQYNRLRHAAQIESSAMLDFQKQLRLTHYTKYNADAAFLQRKKHGTLIPNTPKAPPLPPTPEGDDTMHPAKTGKATKSTAKTTKAPNLKANPWD